MNQKIESCLIIILDFMIIILISMFSSILRNYFNNYYFFMFFWSIILLIFCISAIKLLKIKIEFNLGINLFRKTIILPLILGVLSGIWFFYLKEPIPHINTIFILILDPLIVSIAEELNYRGLIQKSTSKSFGLKQAIIIQAIFFSIMHFNFQLIFLSSYFIFGIIAGLLAEKTKYLNGSIYYSIIFHYITNLIMYIFIWINY